MRSGFTWAKRRLSELHATAVWPVVPNDPAARQRRTAQVRQDLARRYAGYANKYRDALVKFYGAARGNAVKYAQAYEVCEYGRQPSAEEMKRIFAF